MSETNFSAQQIMAELENNRSTGLLTEMVEGLINQRDFWQDEAQRLANALIEIAAWRRTPGTAVMLVPGWMVGIAKKALAASGTD